MFVFLIMFGTLDKKTYLCNCKAYINQGGGNYATIRRTVH
jgi:hypothetical protein